MRFGFIIPHNWGVQNPRDVLDVTVHADNNYLRLLGHKHTCDQSSVIHNSLAREAVASQRKGCVTINGPCSVKPKRMASLRWKNIS